MHRLYPVINTETKASFSHQKPSHWVLERLSSMAKPHTQQMHACAMAV